MATPFFFRYYGKMPTQILQLWRRARNALAEPQTGSEFQPVRNVLGAWSIDEARQDARIREMIWKLKESYQFQDSVFESDIRPIVDYTLRYFGPLPASQNHHHGYRFGASIHALDVARRSMQMVQAMGVEEPLRGQKKAQNERAWYQAVVLASVLHDAGKPMTDIRVRDRYETDRMWLPVKQTLEEFCADNSGEIHIEWVPKRHRRHEGQTEFLAGVWMARLGLVFNPDIHELFIGAIRNEANNNLARKIRKADSGSTENDVAQISMTDTEEDAMEPLVQMMREMIRTRDWEVNRPGSAIYRTKAGVHLIWPAAIKQMLHRMQVDGVSQWKHMTPDEVLDRLGASGVIALHKVSGNMIALERFLPANLKESVDPLSAIRIMRADLLGLEDVEPVEIRHLSDQAGRNLLGDVAETDGGSAIPDETEKPDKDGRRKSDDDAREIMEFVLADTQRHQYLYEEGGGVYGKWPEIFVGCGMKTDNALRAMIESGLVEAPREISIKGQKRTVVRFTNEGESRLRTALGEDKGNDRPSDPVPREDDSGDIEAEAERQDGAGKSDKRDGATRSADKKRDTKAAEAFLKFLAEHAGETFQLKDGVSEAGMRAINGPVFWRSRDGKAWLREEVLYQFSGIKTEFAEYGASRIAEVMRAEGVIIGDPVLQNHPILPEAAEKIWSKCNAT